MTSTEAYLALNLLPKIGPIRVRRLLATFGSPERALAASRSELRQVEGIGSEMADQIANWEKHIDLPEEQRRIADHGIRLVTLDDDEYPTNLREIHDPPFLLYVKGTLLPRDNRAIGVVGSRRCTHYGREATRKLSYQLAHAGITILSGLARGIDTAAHEAALAAEGRTIAVLGSGVGNIYPPENKALAERISQNGAVISEFPVLYVPDRQSFPLRNRIVSGMSEGILVAEAPHRSGSLITANQALEQGRSVYAIPGPIDRDSSTGCNRLIQQGAKLVLDAGDILEDLSLLMSPAHAQTSLDLDADSSDPGGKSGTPLEFSADERAVLDATEPSETQLEIITTRCGLPVSVVSTVLLQLEMRHLVKQFPGKYFAKLI